MLIHPTLDNLRSLKLHGMVQALESQMQTPDTLELPFDDRLGILVDAEMIRRENSRLQGRLRASQLKQSVCIEDLDFRTTRGLDRSLIATLSTCQWLQLHRNIVIDGPTGSGKSFLASALAQKCCRDGYSVLYQRSTKLFHELSIAKATGRYCKLLSSIAKRDVLVIDDFGLSALNDEQRHDLLEIMEDRYERRSTIVAGQLPVEHWHEAIGDATIADAILDRLIHNSYKIHFTTKKSMREKKSKEVDE